MKKLLLIIAAVLSMLLIFSACGDEQPVYHAVTFESNGSRDYPGRTIEDGALIIKPENPTRAGYRFLGWYSGEKLWNFENDRVKSSIRLVARWERISYVVSFESDGAVISTQTVEEGNFATEPLTPTKENHRFLGWFYENTQWNFSISKILENTTLTAKWEPYPTYTVTFDSDGGSAVAAEHIILGNRVSEPQPPTKANHEFLGWYIGDTRWDFDTPVTDSVTLKAKWKSTLTYKVTFNPNNGDDVFVHEIPAGKTVTKPEPVSTPLSVFDGWFYAGEPFNFDTPINSDITLVAKWQISYIVTIDDGVNSPVEMILKSGSSIAAPDTPQKPGHKFMGWYYGSKKWSFTTDKVTSNMTLKAKWEEIKTYTVTFDSNGGTSTPTAQQRPEGSTLTEPIPPEKDNAKFLGWYLGDKKWDFVKDKVSSSITLTAKWQAKYTVTFNSNGGTAISPQTVLDGELATNPQNPTKKDSSFIGWYLGNTKWDFSKDKVTSNITLTAKWEPYPTYTVTFDSDGGTAIEEKYITKGYTVSEPAAPEKAEHTFIGWYLGDTKWDFANGKVNGNITLKAKWEAIPKYTVTFNSDGGTEIAQQTILKGGYVTAPASPTKLNNRFLGWFNNGTAWDFSKNTVTESITLTAKWEEAPKFTVTFDSDGGTPIPSQTVFYGNTATRPSAPTKTDYTFRGWYTKDGVEWNFDTQKITDNITLKAVWDHTYTISFDSNGGNESIPSQLVIYGNYAKEPTPPTKDNCEFAGWYNGNQVWDFSTGITTSLELVARWNCTVIFDSDGGSAIDSQTVIYGNCAAEPTAPTKPHHDFLGWYVGDTEWSFSESAVNGSVTLTAKWREHPKYTVTFKIREDTTLIAARTLYVNSLISEPDPDSIEKIRIKGWYLGDKEWDFANDKLTEDITLTADAVNIYTVTFDTPDGVVPIAPIIVEEGQLITGIADPQKTYHIFEGWKIYGTNKFWNMETDKVTSDITLKAVLSPLLPPDNWGS